MTTDSRPPTFSSALLDSTAEQAMSAIDEAGEHAVLLIEQWLTRGNVSALSAVAEHTSAPVRKAARRAVGILRSRGIAAPERPNVANVVAARAAPPTAEAWMLAPDARGGVVMVLAARAPARRQRTAFIYLHDMLGIQRVEAGEQSQRQLREAMARLAPSAGMGPVAVPIDWARHRIAQARRRHEESGHPPPLGLMTASALLGPCPTTPPPHPLLSHDLSVAAEDADQLVARSADLHRLPEFRGWLPPRSAVDEMLASVGTHLTPEEKPSQERMGALLEEAVRDATDRLFSPEARQHLVETMRDSALSVLGREGPARAREVVATMDRILAAGLITNPPHEIGFLRTFFDKAVAVLLAQGQGSLRFPVRHAHRAPTEGAPAGDPAAGTPSDTGAPNSSSTILPDESGWDGEPPSSAE